MTADAKGRSEQLFSPLAHGPDTLKAMEAQAWTAIGLLAATLVGTLFYLGNWIDSLGARLELAWMSTSTSGVTPANKTN
ncbi:MAG: hypothetical protein ACRD1T_20455 [Acidimicrobiia bacterium]